MRPSSGRSGTSVWVAMSGGVDSSVAAALLLESGADVTGATMRLAAPGVNALHDASIEAAVHVCAALGIPHRVVDVADEFAALVRSAHKTRHAGSTPNPCVSCNESVKFGVFFEQCRTLGAELFATGHYARIVTDTEGEIRLHRGTDATKDQSYFLYRVPPSVLAFCAFPLGEWLKSAVAEEAGRRDLPVLAKESQDVCMPELFALDSSGRSGVITDSEGRVLGNHDNVAAYTIGQRKGLGVGGDGPYYVTGLDTTTGTVTVGPREQILRTSVRACDPVWLSTDLDASCTAQVRYRSEPSAARARVHGAHLVVEFDDSIEAPTPGQSVVCYVADIVIGGGVISSAW